MSRLAIAAPIRPTAHSGNDVTAARWAGHLRALGHEVRMLAVDEADTAPNLDHLADDEVLVALHARRSSALVAAWRRRYGPRPMVVAMTGTDLYLDLPEHRGACAATAAADRVIVLQSAAVDRLTALDPTWGAKAVVVHQSVDPATLPTRRPAGDAFRVVVLAHLRAVKDPLLAARAVRRLPADRAVVVHHAGRALDEEWAQRAAAEEAANPRYRWHRELDRTAALDLLATAQVLACTSVEEGGANVVTEAFALGVPIVGTRIDGNTGLLGTDHPGLVPVGDDAALAAVLDRLATDPAAVATLERRSLDRRPLTDPAVERDALGRLIDEVIDGAAS